MGKSTGCWCQIFLSISEIKLLNWVIFDSVVLQNKCVDNFRDIGTAYFHSVDISLYPAFLVRTSPKPSADHGQPHGTRHCVGIVQWLMPSPAPTRHFRSLSQEISPGYEEGRAAPFQIPSCLWSLTGIGAMQGRTENYRLAKRRRLSSTGVSTIHMWLAYVRRWLTYRYT